MQEYRLPRDKPKSFTGDIPWITTGDLNTTGYTTGSKSGLGLTIDEIKQVKRKIIPKGSVLMSCIGDLGLTTVTDREVVINQQLHSFQCSDEINNLF